MNIIIKKTNLKILFIIINYTNIPPQLLPEPAVQPKQWSAVFISFGILSFFEIRYM
tara:strand:- start:1925 stop:2092 length:168 start_codon:yes stop_codon:yes gene_type:complete